MESAWKLAADIIVTDTHDEHPLFDPIFDGRTGAFTGVASSRDGATKVFIKWAASDAPFAWGCLTREVDAHSWLTPDITSGITVEDSCEDESGLAAAFTYFEGADISTWTETSLQTALDALADIHERLASMDAPIDLPDVESRASTLTPSRFDPYLHAFQELAFSPRHVSDICHGDIHKKNFLVGDTQMAIIDWSWVTRLPRSFDVAMLAVDAALDGFDPVEVMAVAGEIDYATEALGAYGAFLESASVESTAHQMHPHQTRTGIIDAALERLTWG
jgi:hypothetical protein